MRIVGGSLKGRVLLDFSKIGVRPTSDMARESLFNILQNRIYGASFLDLFSGTGAVGIEAYSRGAKTVVLNDIGRESVKLIERNLQKLGISSAVTLRSMDALTFIDVCNDKFDVIFIDPPYDSGLEESLLERVDKILNDDGVVIYETEKPIEKSFGAFEIKDRRRYGRAHLTFFVKGE